VLGFPLLLVPFAIYNMIAFIVPMDWGTKLYTFRLMSGVEWSPTLGDAFIVFSLLLLMFEFIKATNHGKSVVEHLLSIVLAGGAAAEFILRKEAGASIFALFVAICFVDMFAGFAASLRRARRRAEMATPPVYVEPVPARPAPPPVMPAPPPVMPGPPPVIVPPAPMRVEPVKVEPAMPAATMPVIKVDPVQKIEP
jgi:hypothetical protein